MTLLFPLCLPYICTQSPCSIKDSLTLRHSRVIIDGVWSVHHSIIHPNSVLHFPWSFCMRMTSHLANSVELFQIFHAWHNLEKSVVLSICAKNGISIAETDFTVVYKSIFCYNLLVVKSSSRFSLALVNGHCGFLAIHWTFLIVYTSSAGMDL